ncbi:MAG TPA: hypothetical protein VF989_21075 [Polyangiaceae bacterium]
MSFPLRKPDHDGAEAPGLEIVSAGRSHAIGTWQNVVIAVWSTAMDFDDVERLDAALEGHLFWRREVALIQVIEETAEASNASVRRGLARLLTRHAAKIPCSAFIVGGTGFHAAAARAIITSVALVSKARFPQVVLSNPMAAANWVDRHLNSDAQLPRAAALGAAIERVRLAALVEPGSH